MSSEYTPSRGGRRRSSRRGSSDRSHRNGSSSRSRSESSTPAKAKKQTFWQKITSFFSGKPAPKAAATRSHSSSDSSESAAPARSSRPKRTSEDRPSGFRKPEIIEVTTPRIYVGNLSFDAAESDLFELFNGVGQVQNVEIVTNKYNQKSKGFAFVSMQSIEEAQRAVAELHDKEYMGRKLVVSGAKAAEERRTRQTEQPEAEVAPEAAPEQ